MKKTYEEQNKVWEKILNDLNDEVFVMKEANIEPKLVICDAEGYVNLYNAFQNMMGLIFIPSQVEIKNLKKINVAGFILTVIQRVEPEFKGIHVYGTLIKSNGN